MFWLLNFSCRIGRRIIVKFLVSVFSVILLLSIRSLVKITVSPGGMSSIHGLLSRKGIASFSYNAMHVLSDQRSRHHLRLIRRNSCCELVIVLHGFWCSYFDTLLCMGYNGFGSCEQCITSKSTTFTCLVFCVALFRNVDIRCMKVLSKGLATQHFWWCVRSDNSYLGVFYMTDELHVTARSLLWRGSSQYHSQSRIMSQETTYAWCLLVSLVLQ